MAWLCLLVLWARARLRRLHLGDSLEVRLWTEAADIWRWLAGRIRSARHWTTADRKSS